MSEPPKSFDDPHAFDRSRLKVDVQEMAKHSRLHPQNKEVVAEALRLFDDGASMEKAIEGAREKFPDQFFDRGPLPA